MNDDFLLDDEDEELNEDDYYIGEEDTDDEEDEDLEEVDDEESDKSGPIKSTKLTADEIWLRSAYDDIVAAGAKLKDDSIQVAAQTIVMANPKHTSTSTVNNIIRDIGSGSFSISFISSESRFKLSELFLSLLFIFVSIIDNNLCLFLKFAGSPRLIWVAILTRASSDNSNNMFKINICLSGTTYWAI